MLSLDFKATTTTSGGSRKSVTFNSNFRPSERLAVWPGEKSSDDKRLAAKKNCLFNLFIYFIFVLPTFFLGRLTCEGKRAFHLFFKGRRSFAGSSSDYYCAAITRAAQFIGRNAANFLLALVGGDMVCFSCFWEPIFFFLSSLLLPSLTSCLGARLFQRGRGGERRKSLIGLVSPLTQ